MNTHLCMNCGTQFPSSETPPAACAICADERQYTQASGQRWTTLEAISAAHELRAETLEPSLTGLGAEPRFGIGQRALLVQTPAGNLLWDCIALIDDDVIRQIEDLGGIDAIAISHPHFYNSMVEWAEAFDSPIHLHAADRQWIHRPSDRIRLWEGERTELFGGLTLHRLGGHFEGGQVLEWPDGAQGRGALLTGDIVHVVPDPGWVSFMYSYPNHIPLPGSEVSRIGQRLEELRFDRIYGAWWGTVIGDGAKARVRASVDRYLRALEVPVTA